MKHNIKKIINNLVIGWSFIICLLWRSILFALTPKEIVERYEESIVTVQIEDKDGFPLALGSGFSIKPNIIVTNYHVIKSAFNVKIKPYKKNQLLNGKIIEKDESRDIAIVGVYGSSFKPMGMGDSNLVAKGEPIVVIGNPLGEFEGTITEGIISGFRKINGVSFLIISAPISPGNSGSPILNTEGQVIGIATETMVKGQNLVLGIAINYVKNLLNELSLQSFDSEKKGESFSLKLEIPESFSETAIIENKPGDTPSFLLFQEYINRGNAYYDAGKFKESLQEYKKALLYEQNGEVYYRIGCVYLQMGETKKALTAFNNSLKYDPSFKNYERVQKELDKLTK